MNIPNELKLQIKDYKKLWQDDQIKKGAYDEDFEIIEYLKKKYIFDSLLGAGSGGIVWKAKNLENNNLVAIKIMNNQDGIYEYKILDYINKNAKNIRFFTKLYEKNDFKNKMALVMEYIEGYTVEDYIKYIQENNINPREETLTWLIKNIIEGYKNLHSIKVSHRDVKPENIMVTLTNIKIIDYGHACLTNIDNELKCKEIKGSFSYRSPEFIKEDKSQISSLDFLKSDVYSVGAIFYELITKQSIPTQNILKTSTNFDDAMQNLIISNIFLKKFQNILIPMLKFDPNKRPSMEELNNKLNPRSNLYGGKSFYDKYKKYKYKYLAYKQKIIKNN